MPYAYTTAVARLIFGELEDSRGKGVSEIFFSPSPSRKSSKLERLLANPTADLATTERSLRGSDTPPDDCCGDGFAY